MKPADLKLPAAGLRDTLAAAFAPGAPDKLAAASRIAEDALAAAAAAVEPAERLALASGAVTLIDKVDAVRQRRARLALFLLQIGAAHDPDAAPRRDLGAILR